MSQSLLYDVADGVARITFNAPERLNAVDAAMLDGLADRVEEASCRDDVRVIVISGTGRGFCSGANLSVEPGSAVDDSTLYAAGRAVRAMMGSPKVVVSLVGGVAAGVGLSIAIAADYVLATESSSFVLAFSKIGLMPDGGATALVAASVGRARAMRMALTAEKVAAVDAAAWGLVSECVPDSEFTARGQAVIAHLAALAPQASACTKSAINASSVAIDEALRVEEERQAELLRTSDFLEGVAAFTERRSATFSGA